MPLLDDPLNASLVALAGGVVYTLWGAELWSGAPRLRRWTAAFFPGAERLRTTTLGALQPQVARSGWSKLAGGVMGLVGLVFLALGGTGIWRVLGPGGR
jgi:hypothetical protein